MSWVYDDRDLPALQVTVTRADLDTFRCEGTVIVLTGTDDQGRRVTFAGDSGSVQELVLGVLLDGEAVAEVEPWQVLTAEALDLCPGPRPMETDGDQP